MKPKKCLKEGCYSSTNNLGKFKLASAAKTVQIKFPGYTPKCYSARNSEVHNSPVALGARVRETLPLTRNRELLPKMNAEKRPKRNGSSVKSTKASTVANDYFMYIGPVFENSLKLQQDKLF